MSKSRVLSFLSLIIVITMVVTSCQSPTPAPAPTAAPVQPTAAPVATEVPAAQPAKVTLPAFDSACTPADEATVKPVDKMPAKPLKIAVLGLENNPFWIPVKQGAQKAAEELKAYNVTVDWIVPGEQHTGDVFGPGIEAAIAQKYDAIATIAGEAGVAPFIDKAVAAGIPVATFNSETATKNGRAFFVGADLYKQGEAAGAAMAKAINGKGKVAIITGFLAVEAHELRRNGFIDYLAKNNPDVKIVGTSENQDKGDVAFTQANDFMTANPDLAGIYVTAGGPFGAAEAVDKAGKTGKVQVVSFDFVDETMAYVKKGVIYGTIGQDPFAQGHDPAIRLFNMLVGGTSPECGRMVTKSDVVTKDNISQFWTGPASTSAGALPTFDSACTPADEGTVKPVDKKPAKALKIAVLGLENNPFWIPVKQGAQKAAEELKAYNVTVDWIVPGEQHTGDVFGPGIEAAIAQKYDAIATIAGEAGVAPFIDKAVAAGIPVATFNSETATKNGRAFFVGADLYKQGEAAGAAMAKAINGKGKVAIITGFLAVEAHELRRNGFIDYLAKNNPDVKIVGTSENQDKGDVAFTQANDFMTANPDLAGIYVTAGGPFGAAEAVDKAGKTGKVQVVSFDFVDETMAYVQKGVIYGTIGQDPFAQGHDPAIRLFNMLVGGVMPECGRMVTKSDVVTKDNIDQFWKGPASTSAGALPAFDSACTPADEATVKPVDKKPAKALKIAVLGLENNPFWIPVKQGAQKAAEELKAYNVTVDWIVPGEQHTGDVFGPGIEAAIAQKYDAIATIAGEAGVAPFIDKAVAAGIPVATFNSETATKNGRAFFVGADLYKQGEAAGAAMAKAINGKGKVAIITGFLAVEAHELRRKGFVDYLAKNNPDVKIVGTSENQDKGDVAFTQANDFMTANPDLAGIYVTAGGPFGAAEAVDKAGKTGKVQVVSFDFVDETMAYVKKGVIFGTIGQDPFAQGHDPAIRLFNMLVGGVMPECGRMVTKSDVVTKDNIDQFWTAPK